MFLDMRKLLSLFFVVIFFPCLVLADETPDGIVNTDGATIIQPTNGKPVRQGRTKYGEVFVTGKKSLMSWTVCTAANTCPTVVKASAGQITGIQVFNSDTVDAWLKLYNLAVAPTVGTSTIVKSIFIPKGLGAVVPIPDGRDFTVGIAFGVSALPTAADTTVITANKIVVNIDYR